MQKRSSRSSEHTDVGNSDRLNHVELYNQIMYATNGREIRKDRLDERRAESTTKIGEAVVDEEGRRVEKGEVADDEVSCRCSMILRQYRRLKKDEGAECRMAKDTGPSRGNLYFGREALDVGCKL